jgi:hypothetical protein
VDALWKLPPARRQVLQGRELPTGRAGFHNAVELLTAGGNSTYTVFRNLHRCGGGDGFSYTYFIQIKKSSTVAAATKGINA